MSLVQVQDPEPLSKNQSGLTIKTSCSTNIYSELDGQAVNFYGVFMSNKLPYVQMRYLFEDFLNLKLFNDESRNFHGWEKEEFLSFLKEEIIASAEEETYDITIEAPAFLQ